MQVCNVTVFLPHAHVQGGKVIGLSSSSSTENWNISRFTTQSKSWMAQICQNRRRTDISVLTPTTHNPQVWLYYAPCLFATPAEATQLCIMTAHVHAQALYM